MQNINVFLRKIAFYVLLFLVALSYIFEVSAEELSASSGDAQILPIAVVNTEVSEKGTSGRIQLDITIVPTADQSKASQKDLVTTVMYYALEAQKQTKAEIVVVNMIAQNIGNAFGEPQLALVTYIPDGKGYDGKQSTEIWERVMAVPRGFTEKELQYLAEWASLREQYQDKNGNLSMQAEELMDEIISKNIGIEEGSSKAHLNFMDRVILTQ